MAAVALEEFRIVAGSVAEERNTAPAEIEEMARRLVSALEVVAADRDAGLVLEHRAPAHEMRALAHELLESCAVFEVIPVAEQDDAVRLAAVLEIDMPVA